MSIQSAGWCSPAGWLRAGRAGWEPARAHLKPPFPFGSLACFLSCFRFPAAVLWEGQTVPWQLEAKDFEGKIFLVTMWIYSPYLWASLCITACQDLMDAIHVGYLLSSLKVGILQVTMLIDSIFYRNAHLSGVCFSSQGSALFLLKLLAIPVTKQEGILLCDRLNEWRIRPLQNMWFSWWLYWGEQSKGIWNFRVSDSSTNMLFIFNGSPPCVFFICLLLFKDNSLRIAYSPARVS